MNSSEIREEQRRLLAIKLAIKASKKCRGINKIIEDANIIKDYLYESN